MLVRFGKLAGKITGMFDCRQDVFYADVDWDMIVQLASSNTISYSELPRFPEVRRDLSLLVDKEVTFDKIEKLAFAAAGKLLKQVDLFDVYEGEKLEARNHTQ